jgi:hypothetical protein
MIENSEVMRTVLTTLLKISNRKDTDINVISTMGSLVKKLEGKYDFLKHIEIKDTRFLGAHDSITVMSDVNNAPPTAYPIIKAIENAVKIRRGENSDEKQN